MGLYYFDTSGLVKRYVLEAGTPWVQALADPVAGPSLFIARITPVEVASAVARRERGGSLAATDAATALADFQHDCARQYRIVEITEGLVTHAVALARRHVLRAYDSVQLAAALEVRAVAPSLILVSADADLNAAAAAEGLAVEDPNSHP